jgi:DNA-binding response OmpR family regulator
MSKKKKILVVEPEKDLKGIIKRMLEFKSGFEATAINDYAEAEKIMADSQQGEWSAVLMEVGYPEPKGYELAKKWRKLGRRIPIIFMFNCLPDFLDEKALLEVSQACLWKPLPLKKFRKTMREVIKVGFKD